MVQDVLKALHLVINISVPMNSALNLWVTEAMIIVLEPLMIKKLLVHAGLNSVMTLRAKMTMNVIRP
jgi:hypothetical protein